MVRAIHITGRFQEVRDVVFVLVTVCALSSCSSTAPAKSGKTEVNLRDFALANCLSWYFEKREWDVTDIQGVAGGYVEMGDSALETYAQISEAVRTWQPDISTKHELDTDLVKCFHLDENEALEALIEEATEG